MFGRVSVRAQGVRGCVLACELCDGHSTLTRQSQSMSDWNAMQVQDLLKPGSRHLSGLEEAIYRNIEVRGK